MNNEEEAINYPPERVTNAVTAYYHLPPIWVGEDPFANNAAPTKSALEKEILTRKLSAGIQAWVHKDGLFIFDFSNWNPGSSVVIPLVKSEPGKKMPKPLAEANQKAVLHVYRRVEVMNAHLACLNTALGLCEKRALPVGQVISPSEHINIHRTAAGTWWFGLNPYWSPIHAYIAAQRGVTDHTSEHKQRQLIAIESVEKSFELLDDLLDCSATDSPKLVTLLLQSVKAYREHDFSGSLIISWTVLEKLVSDLWNGLIEENRVRGGGQDQTTFINSERKKRLEGKDYTASVRIEFLSLLNEISLEMYTDLNKIRSTRNDWLHHLEVADDRSASLAIQAAQRLLLQVTGININLTISHSIEF